MDELTQLKLDDFAQMTSHDLEVISIDVVAAFTPLMVSVIQDTTWEALSMEQVSVFDPAVCEKFSDGFVLSYADVGRFVE